MELTAVLCIKCERAASVPALLPCPPQSFAGFCSVAVPSHLAALKGIPTDQFSPTDLSKGETEVAHSSGGRSSGAGLGDACCRGTASTHGVGWGCRWSGGHPDPRAEDFFLRRGRQRGLELPGPGSRCLWGPDPSFVVDPETWCSPGLSFGASLV